MSRFVLMAGGTGGHLFPAMALAQELRRRGHDIQLMTDHRVASYGDGFPASATHIVPSATPSVSNPIRFVTAGFKILSGIGVAHGALGRVKPDAVIGFGGYPVFPPFVAASLRGIPGILHEQNAVMGRANRALARMAKLIALSFARTLKAEAFAEKSVLVGNPVRDRVRNVAKVPYPDLEAGGSIRLLVFGGSQGARVFADLVPPAIAELPPEIRARLRVVQQCRAEDLDRVAETYRQAKVNVELAAFFDDLPERMAASHLVVSRSGASTIAELTAIGRPAILVPLPGAIDADQKNNALVMEAAGGGWIAEQATLTPLSLGTRLASLLGDRDVLQRAAAAARLLGQPDAVTKLADAAERLAAKGNKPQ
ncbi:undecaprenyldiphospho-muramoylpentapeptide beta-N-acetylglucosaminyltransferase [Devosia sp.]|jgi:UDP-N-acetylglucosamine--N-acetylmuramyl-(pentapeptide) pyrophosphoryl-undecaprenol N-acetylglucosamine transferase|uniref:undecaprenyldiphospho-muramoylpentapeptide beta-N-acetylglucosaminyltransferase n=1 Tax=Devosia sp. TaxID=1871048 RepID=UPI002DDDB1AA|nr:undecaprenyldiphospho-muramoylpentapeptide beta-N-acetylglucosaminyltransferase [Devosia sp.]